jgi:hypothetical protein
VLEFETFRALDRANLHRVDRYPCILHQLKDGDTGRAKSSNCVSYALVGEAQHAHVAGRAFQTGGVGDRAWS